MQSTPKSSSPLEEQLETWRKEQHFVASQVIVKDDDPCKYMLETTRFKCISLGSHDDSEKNNDNKSLLYGGVDVSFPSSDNDDETDSSSSLAVAVYVITNHQGTIVYSDYEYFVVTVPYVSSYLSFREIEPLVVLIKRQLFEKPEMTPSVILVDGNGIFHIRRAGIASFVGVQTGIPTIGVAKSLYTIDGLSKTFVQHGIDESLQTLVNELKRHHHHQQHTTTLTAAAEEEEGCKTNTRQQQEEDGGILWIDKKLLCRMDDNNSNTSCSSSSLLDDDDDDEMVKGKSYNNNNNTSSMMSRQECLGRVFRCSNGAGGTASRRGGIAVKLGRTLRRRKSSSSSSNGGSSRCQQEDEEVLAAALVGHGGRRGGRGRVVVGGSGTRVPIYISVGHNISMEEAVEICARLSVARIPEPVRQADLMGRELLRRKKKTKE